MISHYYFAAFAWDGSEWLKTKEAVQPASAAPGVLPSSPDIFDPMWGFYSLGANNYDKRAWAYAWDTDLGKWIPYREA